MPRLLNILHCKDHFRKDRKSGLRKILFCTCPDLCCVLYFIATLALILHPCAMIPTPMCHDLHTPVPWSPLSNRFPPQAPTFGRVTGVTDLVGIWHHVQDCGPLHTSWPPSTAPMLPCSCSKWSKHPPFPPTICLQGHYFNTLCQFRFHRIHCSWV